MKRICLFLSLFLVCVSCGNRERTAPSVYKSRDSLAVLGYEFNEADFEKAVKEKKADIVKLFIDAGMSPNTTFTAGKYQLPVIRGVILL